MAGGYGQLYVGVGAVSNFAIVAASGAGTTLATITSQNSINIACAWVWAKSPGDASLTNFQLFFGATLLGNIPVVGGHTSQPVPISVQYTGDGATAVTVKNLGATLDRVVVALWSVAQASA